MPRIELAHAGTPVVADHVLKMCSLTRYRNRMGPDAPMTCGAPLEFGGVKAKRIFDRYDRPYASNFDFAFGIVDLAHNE